MGLYKIDNVTKEERERRELRRHDIQRILITIGQIALMVGAVVVTILVVRWAMDQIHP